MNHRSTRHTWRHFMYFARCQGCDWESEARNALGNAARHFNATGHTVTVGIEGGVTYCGPEEHARRVAARMSPTSLDWEEG